MNYQQNIKIQHEPQRELAKTLRDLDNLIHRTQILLRQTTLPSRNLEAWQKVKGLWKNKMVEDPLHYQRRIRSEE